jgi:hypothetical protein
MPERRDAEERTAHLERTPSTYTAETSDSTFEHLGEPWTSELREKTRAFTKLLNGKPLKTAILKLRKKEYAASTKVR